MKRNKKAIVLLSGGMDSAVALWWAKAQGYSCRALSFDYGQRHDRELLYAKKLAKKAKVPHTTVRFTLPWGGSSLTNRRVRLPHHKESIISAGGIPSTYVPGRNTLFLSFGLSWADAEKASAIVIGANAIDYSGYPDCRPNYLSAYEKMAQLGTRQGQRPKDAIQILSPLVRLTKADIVRWGRRLNVPLEMTWSCYKGGARPCGRCDACQLRDKGFREADKK